MYIPDFMDDETTDEEFENILEYRKGYPCDSWGALKDYLANNENRILLED